MVNTDIVNETSDDINDKEFHSEGKREDFGAYEYQEPGTVSDDFLKKQHKREVKTDLFSAIASLALTVTPVVATSIKSRRDPIPYIPTKGDYLRLGLANALPILKAVDTIALGGKIQKKMEEKTPFTFNDARNIVNLVNLYKPLHMCVSNYMENISRETKQQQRIPLSGGIRAAAILSTINLVTPFIMYKFTDPELSFTQRFASVMPVKLFGTWVKKLAFLNPKTAQMYDFANAAVKVVSYGNNTLSNAVRPSQGSSLNKTSNTLSGVLDFTSDLLGMNRGNISTFRDSRYDSWSGPSRWGY